MRLKKPKYLKKKLNINVNVFKFNASSNPYYLSDFEMTIFFFYVYSIMINLIV